MVEEVRITQFKVGDRVFDTREKAEFYDERLRKTEKRLEDLKINGNINVPSLLYLKFADRIIPKADTGFSFYVANDERDLDFLFTYSGSFRPIVLSSIKTPCIIAINKFRNWFMTMDQFIETGEQMIRMYDKFEQEFADMEKQIAEIELKIGS